MPNPRSTWRPWRELLKRSFDIDRLCPHCGGPLRLKTFLVRPQSLKRLLTILTSEDIASAYESCDYGRAMRGVMKLADRANEYVDRMQPWKLAKQPEQAAQLQAACSVALNLFRQIVLYMSPVLPRLSEQCAELFGVPLDGWTLAQAPLRGSPTRLADGVVVHEAIQGVSRLRLPQNMLLTIWASDAASWAGPIDATTAPTSAEVDWLRVHSYVEP